MKKEKFITLSLLVQFLVLFNLMIFKDVLIVHILITLVVLAISIPLVAEGLRLINKS